MWVRLGHITRTLGTTTQAFCTEAIEKHIDRGKEDIEVESVRTVHGHKR